MRVRVLVALSLISLPLLQACGQVQSSASAVKGDDQSDKEKLFNLADFVKTNEYTQDLAPYSKSGDLIFGDLQKIGIRTNAKVETSGVSKLTPGSARNIKGEYYLNGSIFPTFLTLDKLTDDQKKAMEKDKEFNIIDIEAKAGFDVEGVEGHVRLFKDDKYKFEKKAVVEQSFTRDLTLPYPVMVGLEADASIGGEIGFRAEALVRQDDAISLRFQPKIGINSSVSLSANALKIVSAGVEGVLTLMETTVATSASMGYLPDQDFTYGDIGMDTAEIKALDGKVSVFAKAGLESLLPKDFEKIWKKISDATGIKLGYKWQHTVWDPEPLYVGKVPARGITFNGDLDGYGSADCSKIRDQLYAAADAMEAVRKKADGLDADIAQTAEANIYKTADSVTQTCGH